MADENKQNIKNTLTDNQFGHIGGSVHIGDINMANPDEPLPQHLTHLPAVGAFVGRQDELTQIDALLRQNKPVLVVNGLGGVGKTTLALAYAHQYGAQYKYIVYVRQLATLIDTFAYEMALQHRLGLNLPVEIPAIERAKILLQRLADLKETNLLVVDNFAHAEKDKLGEFLRQFPFGTWRVLFTSREVIPQFSKIDLDVLPPEDASALFRLHVDGKEANEEEINALLAYVGFHTLAVELLAKIYKKSWDLGTVGEMVALLKEQKIDDHVLQELVHTDHAQDNVEIYKHLLRIFAISPLSEEERYILKQFAVLPSKSIAGKDFLSWIQDDAKTYRNTLRSLGDKRWLACKGDTHFTMHPLVQMLIRKQLKPCLPDCINLVNSFIDIMASDKVEARPLESRWLLGVGEALLRYIDFQVDLAKKGVLWAWLYRVYNGLGDYENALRGAKESLALAEQSEGKQSQNYLRALNNLGGLHYSLGDYAEALSLHQDCLQLRKDVLGERHPDYLTSLNNLGLLYKDMGNYTEALPLYEDCLQLKKDVLGERHPDYLTSLNNLGALHQAMGNYAEALLLYEDCLRLRKDVLGERHPAYLTSLNNLGGWHFGQGQYQEALPYFEEAYREYIEVLGKAHPDTKIAKKALYLTQIRLIEARLKLLLPEDWQSKLEVLMQDEKIKGLVLALIRLRQELKAME